MQRGEELTGPSALGKAGDTILENDEVIFVIDAIATSAGFAESGGNIIDAADAKLRKDEIGQVFTHLGKFPRQGVYEKMTTGTLPDGAAFVEVAGHELREKSLAVITRYTLHGADRAVLIETTLKNEGTAPIAGLILGDAIQWGVEKFSPDRGKRFRGPAKGSFVGGVGAFASYAIAATDGDIDSVSGGWWTNTMQQTNVTIDPGKNVQYARIFLVGPRADTGGLVAELTRAAGGTVGNVAIDLEDSSGQAVTAADDARAVVSVGGKAIMDVRASRLGFSADLPPGSYDLVYGGGGGRTARGAKVHVDVVADQKAKAKLGVGPAGKLALTCMGKDEKRPIPCKVIVLGVAPTETPDLGPEHLAAGARNRVASPDGAITLPLPPGKYRVTLARGPEYTAPSFEVEVLADKDTSPCEKDRCTLARVVDTGGYVSADFHQHTMLGVDAPASIRDRIVGNASEGLEVAVASEHNVVADLAPVVTDLGLRSWLVEVTGNELTTDSSAKPWGHANVFPLVADPSKPRGGATVVRDRTAHDVFTELLAKAPGKIVLQINHPRTPDTGYFNLYGFDRAKGVGTDPGYDARFDALEIWNGRFRNDDTLEDYLALLRTSHPVTPTANTDTHGMVGDEPGYPRTFVRVGNDSALDTWDDARTGDLTAGVRVRRDVVLTNAPFVKVTANGTPIGGMVKGGKVSIKVHVETAPWVKVDTLRIRRVSTTTEVTQPLALTLNAKGALAQDVTASFDTRTDDAFIVIVTGKQLLTPVLFGDGPQLSPYAITGAIWVDADGDGKSLGR